MHREQMLEQKLEYLQGVIRDTQQASNEGWQAIIDEDRLLARINALEDQIRIYHTKVSLFSGDAFSLHTLSSSIPTKMLPRKR